MNFSICPTQRNRSTYYIARIYLNACNKMVSDYKEYTRRKLNIDKNAQYRFL